MRTLVLTVAALAPIAAHAVPALDVSGSCPGEVTIEMSGLTPGGNATLLFGPAAGADAIPAGACRGVETGLSPARWILTVPDSDLDGSITFSPTVPPTACDKLLQVLDASTCTLSETIAVGAGGGGEPVSELAPGDLLVLGMNTDAPDDFAFVTLVDIAAGVSVFFTDNGVFADGTLRATEGEVEWITADVVPAGTVLVASDIGLGVGSMALSASGDQLIAYQGLLDEPSVYIFGLNVDGADWAPEADSSNNSALPLGLAAGESAVAVAEADNVLFTVDGDTLTRAELRAQVGDPANWVGDNSLVFDFVASLPATFTFTD
ncbi:MAG: hypothetical protein ACI8PZ_005957 [Myxococcota bacterium]|jgi:hypothetical protein